MDVKEKLINNDCTLLLPKEETDKKSKEMDFSDSRQYSVASQDGVVQEIQGGFSIDVDEVRANFQRQMKHLASRVFKESSQSSSMLPLDSEQDGILGRK